MLVTFVTLFVLRGQHDLRLPRVAGPEARQMPQIFINRQRVGGLAGLQAALKEMGL